MVTLALFIAAIVGTPLLLLLGSVKAQVVALAVAGVLLPLAALGGIAVASRRGREGGLGVADVIALACVLQWFVMLAVWGLLPGRLWA